MCKTSRTRVIFPICCRTLYYYGSWYVVVIFSFFLLLDVKNILWDWCVHDGSLCCRSLLFSATTWTFSHPQATVQEAAQSRSTLCKQRACLPTKREQLPSFMLSKGSVNTFTRFIPLVLFWFCCFNACWEKSVQTCFSCRLSAQSPVCPVQWSPVEPPRPHQLHREQRGPHSAGGTPSWRGFTAILDSFDSDKASKEVQWM